MTLERTLDPAELKNAATQPGTPGWTPEVQNAACEAEITLGDQVGIWRVEAKLFEKNGTQVFLGCAADGRNCALKLYAGASCPDPDAVRVLQTVQIPGIPALYEAGVWKGRRYECMQLIQGVPLDTVQLPSECIAQKVLPAVLRALIGLRDCGLRHNDIKPANLLWNAQHEQVWLIDYGTVTRSSTVADTGGTPGFMAPELLLYGAEKRTEASEVCSFGMTILQLFAGRPLIRASDDPKQALRLARQFWQRELELPAGVPSALCQPLRRCVNRDPAERPRLEELASAIGLQAAEKATETDRKIIPLRIGGKSALSVGQLLELIAEEWDEMKELLACGRVARFLTQFGGHCYACAERSMAEMERDPDAALFRLSQELMPQETILWLGRRYASLAAFQTAAEKEGGAALGAFLRGKCLSFYLKINQQDPKMIEFAQRLERPENAKSAIAQLRSALSGTPDVTVCGRTLSELKDLFQLLYDAICNDRLDETAAQLLQSDDFAGWLDHMGLNNVLQDAKNTIEGAKNEF